MKTASIPPRNGGQAQAPALDRAEVQLPDDPFLLTKFEDFYMEVVQLKVELADPASSASAKQARQRLLTVLSKQKADVERNQTRLGVEMYRQAQYVMACLADEIFSALYQARRDSWPPLETELFGPREAGGLSRGGACLQKLDQLLRQDDPVYRELASVYFHALSLRGLDRRDADDYLAPLYATIAAPELSASAKPRPLFAQSYAHTLDENKTVFLPSAKKWLLVLASVLLVWIAVSSVLWLRVGGPIQDQLHGIQQLLP
jgi:type VI secretion system protein ImpK